MSIEYRQAEEKDIEALVDLRLKLISFECKEEIKNEEELRKNIKEVIEKELNKTIYFFIALDEEKLIASSAIIIQTVLPFVTMQNGQFGFITNVFTEEKYRERGIQKELIRMSLKCADKCNCKRIELNASNPNAIKLYEIFGFKKISNKFRLELK